MVTLIRQYPASKKHKWHVGTGSDPLCGIVFWDGTMMVTDVKLRSADTEFLGSEVCVKCRRKMGAIL